MSNEYLTNMRTLPGEWQSDHTPLAAQQEIFYKNDMDPAKYKFLYKIKPNLTRDEIVSVFMDPDFIKKPFHRIVKKLGLSNMIKQKIETPHLRIRKFE